MIEPLAVLAILWCAGMFVFCVAGLIEDYRARRRSSNPPSATHSRRVGGPVASPLTYHANRQQAARDRAIEQVLREAGYPIDEEMPHRGSRR